MTEQELIGANNPGTGTESKRTGSGTGTFKILRTETFILMNKVPEPSRSF